jgi:hypothetical protein
MNDLVCWNIVSFECLGNCCVVCRICKVYWLASLKTMLGDDCKLVSM